MIMVEYNEQLKNKAQEFLIRLFDDKKFGTEANSNLISVAMIILQGVGWVQTEADLTPEQYSKLQNELIELEERK